VAPDAQVMGKRVLGAGRRHLVRRGPARRQRADPVGEATNIQENCVLHTDMGFR
jgi:carbonic anhydrase/acetyltransferase-like protein (isoleucine patch superfamily)